MKLYRQYLIVGGMPECVLQFVETKDYILVRHIQDTILASYLNDMSKYKDGQEPGICPSYRKSASGI